MNETRVSLFLDYGQKEASGQVEPRLYNEDEIFDVQEVLDAKEAFSFAEKDFNLQVEDAAKRQLESLKANLEKENEQVMAKKKLELSMKYTDFAGNLVNNIKQLLVNEFSISDIPVIESIVEKSSKQLGEEKVEKVFVSEATFQRVKEKVGEPIISVLGARSTIGIGYGLGDQQIMLEGGRTVIVSDLDVIIDGYIPVHSL